MRGEKATEEQCDWPERLRSSSARAKPGRRHGQRRATALVFAREGAKVLAVDHRLEFG